MLIVKNKSAINLEAFKCFYYDEQKSQLIFEDIVTLKVKNAAAEFEAIVEAYERGATVYRVKE